MKTYFENFTQVFDTLYLNEIEYLVLRGFENEFADVKHKGAHKDIDLLCKDPVQTSYTLGALPNPHKKDLTHFFIFVDNQQVDLDLRHIGDGYYCKEWEIDMLKKRIMFDSFYIMDEENYFYSLLYHATIQKKNISEDYRAFFLRNSNKMGVSLTTNSSKKEYISILEQYMRQKAYRYVYTEDPSIPLQISYMSKDLLDRNFSLWIRRRLYLINHYLHEMVYFLLRVAKKLIASITFK